MVDQKKIDQVADKSAKTYIKNVTKIVKTILKTTKGLSDDQFGKAMKQMDLTTIVQNQMQEITTDYAKAHIEILKDKKPIK